MYKNIKAFLKKQWLVIWIVTASAVLFTLAVSAEYASATSKMNRVVRSVSEQGMMFSSNYLIEGGGSSYVAKYVAKSSTSFDIDVYIWNYSIENLSKWYPGDIEYTITAVLTDTNGTALTAEQVGDYSFTLLDSDTTLAVLDKDTLTYTNSEQVLKYSETQAAAKKYTIKYPENWNLDNTDFCVKLTASPNKVAGSDKYKDLKELSAVLGLKELRSGVSSGWQVYISEQNASKDIGECDAYNVVASGSGKATITLTWDTKYLDFNKYFYNDKSVYSFGTGEVTYTEPDDKGIAKLVINADTGSELTGNRNRYNIQLYKTGAGQPESWEDLGEWITMTVSEDDDD